MRGENVRKRFKYLISYEYIERDNSLVIGDANVTLQKPIRTFKQLDEIREELMKKCGARLLSIRNCLQVNK